jgi:hypothetical protein
VITLLLCLIFRLVLVILELLILLALISGVAAAEDEEADRGAEKEQSDECVHQNKVNRHEEAVFKLVAVRLDCRLELQVPSFIGHVDRLLKLSAGSDYARS